MGRKIIVLLVALLLIIPMISAVPPVTTVQQFTEGLIIVTSPQQYLKQNQDFTVNFFVHNQSNRRHISNSSTNCSFYLDNSNGTLVLNQKVNYNENDYWDIVIKGGNFSETGQYNYGIDCHHTFLGGSTSGAYIVNPLGDELTSSRAIIYIGLIGILIFVFLTTFFGIGLLPSMNTKDEEGKILSISYLKYLRIILWFFEWMFLIAIFYLTSNLAFAYLREQLFAKTLFMLFHISLALTPIIVIVWMAWTIASIINDKKIRNLWERGMFPQGRL